MNITTIIRVKSDDPFARIPKALLDDEDLSWKAKGMLCYLLGKPDDWKVRICDLASRSKDGRDATYAGFKELREAGYAIVKKQLSPDGTFAGNTIYIYDAKQPYPDYPTQDDAETVSGFPVSGLSVTTKNECTKKECTKKETKKPSFEIPLNLRTQDFIAAWDNWLAYRSESKHPVSDKAARLQLAGLSKVGPAAAIATIERSIMNDWRGLFPKAENNAEEEDSEEWKFWLKLGEEVKAERAADPNWEENARKREAEDQAELTRISTERWRKQKQYEEDLCTPHARDKHGNILD